MNVVHLLGNLGSDPELKYTNSGTPVCNVSMATNKKVKDEDKTEWHRLVFWGKVAEIISQHCQKGQKLQVTGELRTRSWETDAGETRYQTEVHCQDFEFIGGKDREAQPREAVPAGVDDGDDLPF